MSMIREEVDSLVRVIHLFGVNDYNELADIIGNTFDQRKLGPTKADGRARRILDKSLIQDAAAQFDWLETLYEFGCSFIHRRAFTPTKNATCSVCFRLPRERQSQSL